MKHYYCVNDNLFFFWKDYISGWENVVWRVYLLSHIWHPIRSSIICFGSISWFSTLFSPRKGEIPIIFQIMEFFLHFWRHMIFITNWEPNYLTNFIDIWSFFILSAWICSNKWKIILSVLTLQLNLFWFGFCFLFINHLQNQYIVSLYEDKDRIHYLLI